MASAFSLLVPIMLPAELVILLIRRGSGDSEVLELREPSLQRCNRWSCAFRRHDGGGRLSNWSVVNRSGLALKCGVLSSTTVT